MAETIDLIWGGEEIAKVIGRTPRVAFQLLERGMLPARKINGRWVAERNNLISFFMGSDGSTKMTKAETGATVSAK